MILTGKGYFIKNILNCEHGDSQAIAINAQKAGLSHVIIEVADRTNSSNVDSSQGIDYAQRTAQSLKAVGVQSWGWQYITGDNPLGEARKAIQRVNQLHLDGFVINAEVEYKAPGKEAAAREYMAAFRASLPNLPLALSSYRFPSYHPQLPWREFLEKCDLNMPKVFWVQAHNPYAQLARCVNEFEVLQPFKPVIPTGAVFSTQEWQPSTEEVSSFLAGAAELNLSAINFWSWDTARTAKLLDLWNTIQIFTWPASTPLAYITQAYFAALNSKDPAIVTSLYDNRSVHVTSERSIQGTTAIKKWYADWFAYTHPTANFELLTTSGKGNSSHFTWKATITKPTSSSYVATKRIEKSFLTAYKELYQGIFYQKQTKISPREHTTHTVVIDLNNPDIDLMVTPRNGMGQTTSRFLEKYNLQLAVNGDEWLELDDPKGLAVAAGDQYSPSSPEPTVYISKMNQVQIGGTQPQVLWDAISGSHTIVRDGQISQKILSCAKPDVYCQHLAPRTALGLTAANYLILIVVEGPPENLRDALTLKELAQIFVNMGAQTAITLDGGGSSTLTIENYDSSTILNTPSDGSERAVANHLGIYAKKLETIDIISDGSDTFGLLDDKIIYHLTLFSKP